MLGAIYSRNPYSSFWMPKTKVPLPGLFVIYRVRSRTAAVRIALLV